MTPNGASAMRIVTDLRALTAPCVVFTGSARGAMIRMVDAGAAREGILRVRGEDRVQFATLAERAKLPRPRRLP